MIPVFAVGDSDTALRLLGGKAILYSFAYVGSFVKEHHTQILCDIASELWIDSGAFTVWNREKAGKPTPKLTTESYARYLLEDAPKKFSFAVNLDAIGDDEKSFKNWQELVAMLGDTSSRLVPVWHEGDPIEQLDEYDPNSRVVGLGRTEGRKWGSDGKRKTFAFYDSAFNRYPDGKFHLLGNCTPETIEPYPARSFDATSWQRNASYSNDLGWPWNRCSKTLRMLAHISAIETIAYRPDARRFEDEEAQVVLFQMFNEERRRTGS